MTSNTYSLANTVSFLEAMLDAMGERHAVVASEECRESLRERFRRVVRLLKRLRAKHDLEQEAWSLLVASHHSASALPDWDPLTIGEHLPPQPENVFTRKSQPSNDEQLTGPWARFYSLSRLYAGRLNDLPAPVPFLAKVARLDVAIQVGRAGVTAFYVAVMDLWSRRHDILKSDAAIQQQPRRRRSIDRLFLALMRFVVGFFGSHKVDARNIP